MTTPQLDRADAHTALADKVLMMGTGDAVRAVLGTIDPAIGGVVVTGAEARSLARQIHQAHPGMVVIAQPDTHVTTPATVNDPFPFDDHPDEDALELFDDRPSLADWVNTVIADGSTFAVLPTGFLEAGAHPELTAVVDQANVLDRTDVILHLPLSHTWMVGPGDRKKVIAAIRRSRHPVVISLAHESDPASQRGVVEGIHLVLAAVGSQVGLWYSDLGVLDALANGGWCGAIGLTSSNRHIVPPGKTAYAPVRTDQTPNVLLPDLLRWARAQTMTQRWFANGHAPHCPCRICDGRALIRFTASTADTADSHRHNVIVLLQLQRTLLSAGAARLEVWSDMLIGAETAHAALAAATGVMTIAPTKEQKFWMTYNPPLVNVP